MRLELAMHTVRNFTAINYEMTFGEVHETEEECLKI